MARLTITEDKPELDSLFKFSKYPLRLMDRSNVQPRYNGVRKMVTPVAVQRNFTMHATKTYPSYFEGTWEAEV